MFMEKKFNKEIETQEGTGAAGGSSTGAFSGPFFEPIRREMPEGLNLPKRKPARPRSDTSTIQQKFILWLMKDGYSKDDAMEQIYTAQIQRGPNNLYKINYSNGASDIVQINGKDVIQIEPDDPILNEGLNLVKNLGPKYAHLQYRDGTNSKSWFTVEIPETLRPTIEIGDELEIGDFGVSEETMWDNHGPYDENEDHNLVTVLDLYNEIPEEDVFLPADLFEGLNLEKQPPKIPIYDEDIFSGRVSDEVLIYVTKEQLDYLMEIDFVTQDGDEFSSIYASDQLEEKIEDEFELQEGLNLTKKQRPHLPDWHKMYDELQDVFDYDVDKLDSICARYDVYTIPAPSPEEDDENWNDDDGSGIDYSFTLEELVDYFQKNKEEYFRFMETEKNGDDASAIVQEELANLYNKKAGITLTNKDLESELDEGTDVASVGSGGHGSGFAYIDPYGKGIHKEKSFGTWAKNEESMRWNRKPYWPGGTFVTVKKKCQKFPYCNQGDTGALNFSNPKAARSKALSEIVLGFGNKQSNPLYAIVRYTDNVGEKFDFAIELPNSLEQDELKIGEKYDISHFHVMPSNMWKLAGNQYDPEYDNPFVTILDLTTAKPRKMHIMVSDEFEPNLNENKDIYNKNNVMGTAQRLREYEKKLFNKILKEGIFVGNEDDLANDLDSIGGENTLDEFEAEAPVMDVHSIALELKTKLRPNPTEEDIFDRLCDVGYCGSDAGAMFQDVLRELRGMGISINTIYEGGKKKEKWIQGAEKDIEKRGTEGKCTPITKPGCTGKAKTLAKTFKKMAKKKETKSESVSHDVMNILMNENEYRMSGNNIQHLKIFYNQDGSVATADVEYRPSVVNVKSKEKEIIPVPKGDAGNDLINQYRQYFDKKTAFNESKLKESGTPGITMYDKIHGESGTSNQAGVKRSMENAKRLNTVADKTENEKLSGIGKGEPKYGNFDDKKKEYDDDYIGILRGMGLQDLQYDTEPAEDYKKRAEEAIIGSAKMGNDPNWANAQRDWDGTKGELGQKIIDTAKKKKEAFDKTGEEDHTSIRFKYPNKKHEKTHIAVNENKLQNLKTKQVIFFEKDLDKLIPESHKIEGAQFKLFDGKSTTYELKWEGNALVVESEKNKTLVESERNLFKKMSGYSVGEYKVKPKGYLTEELKKKL